MISPEYVADSEVIECLKEAGFPDVCRLHRWHSAKAMSPEVAAEIIENDLDLLQYSFSLPMRRHIEMNAEEWRQLAARTLLDAGFRGFYSKIEWSADHSVYAVADCSTANLSGFVIIEFLNGLTRYTPEQIEQMLAESKQARAKYAEQKERDKAKRQSKSLDKSLRKLGLID